MSVPPPCFVECFEKFNNDGDITKLIPKFNNVTAFESFLSAVTDTMLMKYKMPFYKYSRPNKHKKAKTHTQPCHSKTKTNQSTHICKLCSSK